MLFVVLVVAVLVALVELSGKVGQLLQHLAL
jgi:hypothetical protein